ncbi:GyrI-like domain-containing protein [Paenibacillus sp. GP183]|uniref:GyrI-like domain-containing protein n=1 Tax=Paenibacillus sp. GP183 TaxID=1882751 RepID=UPI0008969767|nr:GyrI-like domain-containing protein [Paenibacillus sp. GP183]SEB92167.1 Predicted transcriptional regulator YdeE, contains AraC-type DNA-binding domain [Paenibacillus sp. GP183]
MAIRIIEREHSRIIGMKLETLLQDTREHQIIPKFQQSFNERLEEVSGVVGLPNTYGLFIDPPNYNPDTDLFTWIAGVEVSPYVEPPVGMISYELPNATYAVLEYQGDIDRAGDAYGELYEWINNSEYEQAGTYGFELYSTVHSPLERGKAVFLLHFPIKHK